MNTRFKFKIGSQTLILVSTLYFTFGLNWALWRYFYDKVSFDNPLFCLALPILLCLPLFLFFNLVIVPKLAKPLLITFLLLSSATNHLMYNLDVYIDKDMIRNAVETNVREASDFFTLTGFLWVLATGVAPIILLMMTKIELYYMIRAVIIWINTIVMLIYGISFNKLSKIIIIFLSK